MAYGINVSIDELDIIPGDNLPSKIFDELIDNCENFIVILSENSIDSKWVNEELDAGMIQKIEKGARLIPIVLDNLERERIPNRLRHVYCHYIKDIGNHDADAKFIADVCLGNVERHKLGPRKIDASKIPKWPGFNNIDVLVLTKIIDIAMDEDIDWIEGEKLIRNLGEELTYEQIVETVDVLESKYYLELERTLPPRLENSLISIPTQTIIYYLKYCSNDPDNKIIKPLASYVLSQGDEWLNSGTVSKELGIAHYLLRKLLDRFSGYDYILCSEEASGTVSFKILNLGKRFFRYVLDN